MPETRLPSLMQQETAPEAEIQSRLPSLGGTEIPFDLPEPEVEEEPRDYGWGITTAFKRGFERLRSLPDVAQGDYEELAQHFENMEKFDLSEHDKQRMQELQNTEGWWDAFAYYIKNPTLIGQVVAESLPMSTAPIVGGVAGGMAGTAVGGPPGTVIGTMGGAAAGSFATEYLASITEYFGRRGIDATDPEQLKQAFSNPELMSDAREFATQRGIPIAIFDGLSFGLAGRIYRPGSALVKGATMGGEMGMQAGAGMAGEAGAQLVSVGEIEDIPGVWAEGFGEVVPGLIEQGANAYMQQHNEQTADDDLSKQLREDVRDEELDKMGDITVIKQSNMPDVLALQAAGMQETREATQVRQYQDMAAQAAEEARINEAADRRSQIWLDVEAQRAAGVERQRTAGFQELEAQQELAKGEAAAEIAPVEEPKTAPKISIPEPTEQVTGEAPGVSVGAALKEAQEKQAAKEQVELETTGKEVPSERLRAPAKPAIPRRTKAINPERDSFLTTRAKSPASERLSQEAFKAEGLDLADMRQKVYGGKPAFSKHPDAMRPDDVAEYLNEQGYPLPPGETEWTVNSVLNAINEEIAGRQDLLTGAGIETAAAEEEYAQRLEEFEARKAAGPGKTWEITVDGMDATVVEEPNGDVEVRIGEDVTMTTRKKGQSNAELVREIASARAESIAQEENEREAIEERAAIQEEAAAPVEEEAEPEIPGFEDTQKTLSITELEKLADPNVPIEKMEQQESRYLDNLEKQIKAEGITSPIQIITKDGKPIVIHDGMHRLAVMRRLGIKEAPVEYVDEKVVFKETLEQDLESLKQEAATSPENDLKPPTKAQKEAGNYKKGHIAIKGLNITVENPVGSSRRGFKMKDHYGYIKRTEGVDGDQVDVFVNPKIRTDYNNKVYVIDQTKEDGVTFDEHKVMLGYTNQLDAVRGYKRNYEKGWKVGPITEMSMAEFKTWLATDTKRPVQQKPSRHGRKFVRTQKGLRYSLPRAKKALLADAKTQVPGVDQAWLEKVIGTPSETIDPMVQQLVTRAVEMQEAQPVTEPQVMTKATAEVAIAPLNKKLPGMQAQVHDSIETMPKGDLRSALLNDVIRPRAVYDIMSDQIHIFANRYRNTTDVIKAALHEGVAHKGLRILFSKTAPSGEVVLDVGRFNTLMTDVYNNATNKTRIRELEAKYTLGPNTTARDKAIVGEEYLAWMAETNSQPKLLARIVAAIRKQLRKITKIAWTDADVHSLLAEARGALRDAKPINEVTLTEQVEVEETGEVFDVETNAEVALRQHDKRVGVVKKLRACL